MSNRSESIAALVAALSKAQGAIKGAKRDSVNTFYTGSKYADLASVWDSCREPLSVNGLVVIQTTRWEAPDLIMLETLLAHSSGEWISGSYPIKPTKQDPQGYGSAMTYARRYGLMAIVGIAPEDDDGNAASGKSKQNQQAAENYFKIAEREVDVFAPSAVPERVPPILKDPLMGMLQKSVEKLAQEKAMPLPKPVRKVLTPQQKFHIWFRDALSPKYQMLSDQLLKDWLNVNFPEYRGSMDNVPTDEVQDRWIQAKKYAEEYQG